MRDFDYVLADYPRVIEPAINVIEVELGANVDSQRPSRLFRLVPAEVHSAIFPATRVAVHFFGPAETSQACDFVLGYDIRGSLVTIFVRERTGWAEMSIGTDLNGQPPMLPSVRLVFKTPRARDLFLYYIDQVKTGKYENPTVAQVLDGLAEDVRSIDVAPLAKV